MRTINQLWLKYSDSRFGFTVQAMIYQEVGEDYPSFCDRVGWSIHNPNTPNAELTFNLKAPLGHLPSRRWVGGYNWWRHAGALTAKLSACGLNES
ncbi:GUN4 domain-containing protein [Limnofasciculus baicalensis]|uniref:GUN4 domain-containing protein n=1 Tax=Limnofasciculus baicalensis TaxID=3064906 RepID=UPI002815F6F2|nr:GUN4 domain-containing protein [Limnofasciculus baicalensis]